MRGAPGNARDSFSVRGSRAWSPERAPVACGCPGSFLLSEVPGDSSHVRPAKSQGWLSGSQFSGGENCELTGGVSTALRRTERTFGALTA
jgi:hypothetical protein